jgi:hypothetical protein
MKVFLFTGRVYSVIMMCDYFIKADLFISLSCGYYTIDRINVYQTIKHNY